jgi:DNA-binding NarL/FixJ family response regulator
MNLYELKNYKRDVEAINESRILANLKNIGIRLPESFKSNHSFINEWCAFVWADYMKFDDFSENILKTIGKYLYFDYLRTILSLDKAEEKAKKVSEGKLKRISDLSGKILLIDDSEYWRDFFEEFFRNSSGVTFKSIGKSFKGKKVTAIIDECVKAVSEFDPDVILLDFRLSEDVDYDVQYNKDVSGRQVLKKLKGSNEDPGEAYADRVIIFSATSKIENIIRLQGDLADDFILKEHPEKYIGKKPTSEAIGSLINKLEKSLLQAQYLKKLDSVIKDLLKEAESMRPDAKDRVRELVSTIRTLLYPNVDDMWLLKLAYLNLCGILEYYKGNENLKKGIDDLVSPIMEHGSTVLVPWQNLCELRNALAHSATEVEFDNGRNTKPVEPELLRNKTIELVKFIRDFVKILVKNNRS